MSKFDFKKNLSLAKTKLLELSNKVASKAKRRPKSPRSGEQVEPTVRQDLGTKLSGLKARIRASNQKPFKLGSFNIDRKHLNRILDLRVERLPTLAQLLPRAKQARLPLLFLLGLLCGDLIMRGSTYFFLSGDQAGEKATRPMGQIQSKRFLKSKVTYDEIISKNVFCPGCPVPDMKMIAINRPKDCSKAKPLRSSANLVGTIVLSNSNYSVATIIDGSQTFALKRGEDFKSFGKVFEIRRTRVCFENQDGLLFFLALPDVEEFTPAIAAGASNDSSRKQISKGIVQAGEHELEIEKNFIVEQLNNPNILYEAYATEYRVDGEIQGFRIHSINPGSTIEKLGFKPGDIITEVDGKPMDSVARAQELYNSAATTSDMNISILRDGNKITKSFTVK